MKGYMFPFVVAFCGLIILIQIGAELAMAHRASQQKKEKQCAIVCGSTDVVVSDKFPLCGCITWKEFK
jgi:hypothetical protein